jgi:hypothetical protein
LRIVSSEWLENQESLVAFAAAAATFIATTAATVATATAAAFVATTTTTAAAAVSTAAAAATFVAATATAAFVAATTTAAATEATAAAGRTIFLRTGDADTDRATIEVFAVHRLDCSFRFFCGAHRDKRESTRFASEFIHHDGRFGYAAVLAERILEDAVCRGPREIAHEEFIIHFCVCR